MSISSRAPFYDLFKLIVAIILFLIFLFLLFWMRPAQTPPPEPLPATLTPLPPMLTVATVSSTSSPLTETPSPTLALPSATPSSTSLPPTETSTPILPPSATEPPVTETLPTPIVEIPSETEVCEAYSRMRLQVGMNATILRRLNFRSSPGIRNNWIKTNIPGTKVEVIGGPTCTRYQNGGAYLWWQIKLPDGQIGWSAEASAFGRFYFIEPVP